MVVNMSSTTENEEQMVIAGVSEITLGTGTEEMVDKLLDKIANSEMAHFKSQQRGEPDLTFAEKRHVAKSILEKGPQHFLARFHKQLDVSDTGYFEQFCGTYEIDFYLKEIHKSNSKAAKIRVKNRRYEALKRLVNDGKYFSMTEMKERNPLMFEQLVGQYMSEQEKEELTEIDKTDLRFTTILMEHIDRDYENNRRHQQQELEDAMFEESEDDDDDSYEDSAQRGIRKANEISEKEKVILKDEFLSTMYQSFLDGHDAEFNYTSVDDNVDYDSVVTNQQDAEDSYFDAEEPKEPENSPIPMITF